VFESIDQKFINNVVERGLEVGIDEDKSFIVDLTDYLKIISVGDIEYILVEECIQYELLNDDRCEIFFGREEEYEEKERQKLRELVNKKIEEVGFNQYGELFLDLRDANIDLDAFQIVDTIRKMGFGCKRSAWYYTYLVSKTI